MSYTVGSKIQQRRKELGMTQLELAQKLRYKDRSTIAKIEKGIIDITQSKVVEFADALDTTPSYIMGWEDEVDRTLTDDLADVFGNLVQDEQLSECVIKLSKLDENDRNAVYVLVNSIYSKSFKD